MAKKREPIRQVAKAGGAVNQAGRDIEVRSNNVHTSFFIGVFFIVVIALGGLTWFLSVGWNENKQTPASQPTEEVTSESE